MLTFILIMVVLTLVALMGIQYQKKWKEQKTVRQNDIVLLKKEYKHKYPNVQVGVPLKVLKTTGTNIEVTFMATKNILNEVVDCTAVRKVS